MTQDLIHCRLKCSLVPQNSKRQNKKAFFPHIFSREIKRNNPQDLIGLMHNRLNHWENHFEISSQVLSDQKGAVQSAVVFELDYVLNNAKKDKKILPICMKYYVT